MVIRLYKAERPFYLVDNFLNRGLRSLSVVSLLLSLLLLSKVFISLVTFGLFVLTQRSFPFLLSRLAVLVIVLTLAILLSSLLILLKFIRQGICVFDHLLLFNKMLEHTPEQLDFAKDHRIRTKISLSKANLLEMFDHISKTS
jgi:hypothetical protein